MKKSIAIICLFIYMPIVIAQFNSDVHSQYRFKHITIDNGLSHNIVYRICEDKQGYIWAATKLGLNRLSGTEIKSYYHDPEDSLSIPSHWVYLVFCDRNGKLWVGTDNGLCTYHEGLDAFIPFKTKWSSKNLSFFDVKEDNNGNLWFGTNKGTFKYNIHSKEFLYPDKLNSGILSTGIYRIFKNSETQFLLSIYPKGLCSYDIENDSIITFKGITSDKHNINEQRIEQIYKDENGDIWFGTYNDGAYKYDSRKKSFSRYIIDPDDPFTTRVRVFFEDNNGDFFVGTRGGLYSYNVQNNKFYIYANSNHDFSQLSANSLLSCFIDHTRGLWLGTIYGGINYTNLEITPFAAYTNREKNKFFLNNPNVFGIDEDNEGNIYVGTEGGINILNVKTSTFSYMQFNPDNKNSLSYNDVKSIAIAKNGDFWAGTNKGGLNFYSKKDKKFKVYKNIPGDTNSLPYDKIYHVFLDSKDDLYVLGNFDMENHPSTLSILRKGKTTFENHKGDFVIGIVEDKNNDIYIGAEYGFCKLNRENENLDFYKNDTLIGRKVSTIYLDRLGKVWIGSNKGLSRYDFETNEFTSYEELIMYPAYNVCGILSDDDDNLWVSTNSGLFKLIGAISKPIDSVNVRLFNKDDGLPSKEFFYNACFKSREGLMYFGGQKGFISFKPEKISDSKFIPRIVISDLILDGNTIREGDTINGEIVLNQSIINTSQIKLTHKTKAFTLKFDALYFANPDKNGFMYMLENFDDEWQYSNNYQNSATYANLPSGKYTFKIYATNNDNVLSENPKVLHIKILPPYWETLWFRIIFIILITSLIITIYLIRVSSLRKQQKILKEKVYQKTNELKVSYDNLRNISEFGQQLTSTLDFTSINQMIYNYVRSFKDTFDSGIGIYNSNNEEIEYKMFFEEGKLLSPYKRKITNKRSFSVYCFLNQKTIILNDIEKEYDQYLSEKPDFNLNRYPKSLINIPLTVKGKNIGLLAVNSRKKNAFNENDLLKLNTLAAYIAIALDNADSHETLRENNRLLIERQNMIVEQSKQLNETNTILEERQQQVEEQAEELRSQAEELFATNEDLKTSNATKDKLFSIIAHDLKNPFSTVLGFTELIITRWGKMDAEKLKHLLERINLSAKNIYSLLENLLHWARSQSDNLNVEPEEILIKNLIQENVELLDNLLKEKNLKIEINIEDNLICFADRQMIKTIVRNIMVNAIKYTEKGSVKISAETIDEKVHVSIKDSGIGISEEKLKTLFEVNTSKSTVGTQGEEGTGLGLIICKEFIESNNGEIFAKSELGKGTIFVFTLPLKKIK